MGVFWTGRSGVGSGPHLDARIWDPRRKQYLDLSNKENRGYLSLLRVGEKGEKPLIGSFPVTSDYGPRNTGIPGASTFHKGVDFGTPEGTPITVQGGAWKEYRYDRNGGGHMGIFGFRNKAGEELEMVLLHGQDRNAKAPRGTGLLPPVATGGTGTLAAQLPATTTTTVVETPKAPDWRDAASAADRITDPGQQGYWQRQDMRDWAAANPALAKAEILKRGGDESWLTAAAPVAAGVEAKPVEAGGAGAGVSVTALPLRDLGVLDDALEARRRGLIGGY